MFSPIGAPNNEEQDVDWLDDLKFFIDNDDAMLNKHFFPAVKKHKEYQGHPNAYKIYIRPKQQFKDAYCNQYDIDEPEEKFSKEKIIQLAKMIASEQERHLSDGDYN